MAFDPYHKWFGIAPSEQPPDFYRLLGLTLFESDPETIANAADGRIAQVKMYEGGVYSAATKRIRNEIESARFCLMSVAQKYDYDQQLRAARLRRARGRLSKLWPTCVAIAGCLAIILAGLLWYSSQDDGTRSAKESSPAVANQDQERADRHGVSVTPTVAAQMQQSEKPVAARPQMANTPTNPQSPAQSSMPQSTPNASNDDSKTGKSAERPEEEAKPMSRPELVAKVESAIVQIKTDRASGSGFVVDESGLIVTNFHVVRDATTATAIFSNKTSVGIAGFVAVDRGQDLVILRTNTTGNVKAIPLRSGLPRKGEDVVAFGSPLGYGDTVSAGIVSQIRTGRELREINERLYTWLGYDLETIWVQTTAPISHGNSGGPLIGMDGAVIGINTWGLPPVDTRITQGGQNLNFAVSSEAVIRLKKNAAGAPSPLASLGNTSPRPAGTGGGSVARSGTQVSITLPTGKVLTETMLDLPHSWQQKLFSQGAVPYVANYPNDDVQGVFNLENGKLDGAAAVFYESGRLRTLVFYKDGRRNGVLKQWRDIGDQAFFDRLLYAEYLNGKKHGLVCLFRVGLPWLIQEWDKDMPQREYLVKHIAGAPTTIPEGEMSPDQIVEHRAAKKQLAAMEEEMTENEARVKRQLSEWSRKEVERARSERARELSSKRTAAISARVADRNAQSAAKFEAIWRLALGRSGF